MRTDLKRIKNRKRIFKSFSSAFPLKFVLARRLNLCILSQENTFGNRRQEANTRETKQAEAVKTFQANYARTVRQ